jgi:hypothetical protein
MGLPRMAASQEKRRICEVTPHMRCLDKTKLEGTTVKVPLDAAAIQKDGFLICDSSFNYTTSPDIVLIMDNTGSMGKVQVLNDTARYCDFPDKEKNDPGCISGDPNRLRGPALKSFLDSALVKGGTGLNVGVVLFSYDADPQSDKLIPLNASTKDSIKNSIVMREDGQTNYTEAFRAAMELLKSSRKPKQEQFIIFVSDGRPNLPSPDDGGAYLYKNFWDSLPVVHSIFLGDNQANYQDMKDISAKTGGLFFPIRDVTLLAKILTDDISKSLFRKAVPTQTLISNLTTKNNFVLDATQHVAKSDSGAYVLKLPGPFYLAKGENDILVRTEYGYGGKTQDVHFKIERSATGPYFAGLEEICRELPKLVLYNRQDQPISLLGLSYLISDSLANYKLTTAAALDTFNVVIRTESKVSAQQDLEAVVNSPANRVDSTWSGSLPFDHQQPQKKTGDKRVQAEHGETVIVTYRHPYIPEDSAQAKARIKYGPDMNEAAYWDLDSDGRIETVTIWYQEDLVNLPDKLQFHIIDVPGQSAERTALASKGEIKFGVKANQDTDRSRLKVTLANPFPYGMTSVANADSSGRTFRQMDVPFVDGTFRVDDSVPPVIARAAVVGPDRNNQLSRLLVTFSEPVNLAVPAMEALVFKRDTVVFTSKDVPINRVEKLADGRYAFHLEAGSPFSLVGGDSAAINNNGEIGDLAGRTPISRTFKAIEGSTPDQKISDLRVTFANGSGWQAVASADVPFPQIKGLIPVDAVGSAMPGGADKGKCPGCVVSSNNGSLMGGSIIYVVTKQPVNYELSIYTNLGQFVARSRGSVEEKDLPLLQKIEDPSRDPNKTDYVQRIVWTGQTDNGMMAGTGAYVLKAVFRFEKSFKTGATASTEQKIRKFGFMRTCCRSYVKWYH